MAVPTITDWVAAIGNSVSASASVALLVVATIQLKGLKNQLKLSSDQDNRKNTLMAIQRLENDPFLQEAFREILKFVKPPADYSDTKCCEFHVVAILNYFDGIAIGIKQGIYINEMAKDYLASPLKKAVEIWLLEARESTVCPHRMFTPNDYLPLRKLYERWFLPGNEYEADQV